jgi:hypothetical protein
MTVVDVRTGESYEISISPVTKTEYGSLSKQQFWFNWKAEIDFDVFKLRIKGSDDILGLISLESIESESRIEIRLLAVSKENRGKNKKFDKIAGNLIAFAGIQAIKKFGEWACISLVPKTELIEHYQVKYFMIQAGRS